jgi:alkylation response protein AidB-like acyl-CoA dehydrogenase
VTDVVVEDRITTLRHHCADLAQDIRRHALTIDRDPDRIQDLVDHPAVHLLRACVVPVEYMDEPLRIGGRTYDMGSCLEHTIAVEELSYGDAGFVLASPGPSMSGVAVAALGDDAQREWYFERVGGAPRWTFFALTEPDKGSAAAELTTALDPAGDGFTLSGRKRYVGNAAHAQLGVVFCRRLPGPVGIEAVLVDTADPGFTAAVLPTVGLRGARISEITLTGVRIEPDKILGSHRRPTQRGLIGAIRTLQRFRPVLAGIALGMTRATLDHVDRWRPTLAGADRRRLDDLRDRVAAARARTYRVAAAIDAGRVRTDRVGAVKAAAAELAEESTRLAAELLGPGSLVTDPWLDKVYRDARAFEFMEGTGNIHRLGVFHGVAKGTFLDATANG